MWLNATESPMNQQISLAPLCDAAERFLSRRQYGLFIDGQEVPAASNKTFETSDPSTGKVLGRLAEGDVADIDRAVRAARAAFEGPWSRWTPYERQSLLYRAHDAIDRNFEELAQIETMDMGAPISRTRATKAGVLWVNCYGLIDPLVGFGGTKFSGYGAKGGRGHLDAYLYSKSVYINT
jgi:aldehyde dehydrogenase (NAD+)